MARRVLMAVLVLAVVVSLAAAAATRTPSKRPTASRTVTPRPRNCSAKCLATNGVGVAPLNCTQATTKPFEPCENGRNAWPDQCGFYNNAFGHFPDAKNCYPIEVPQQQGNFTWVANYYPKWCGENVGLYPFTNGTYPDCPEK